jgi:hypothetical protein
MSFVAVGAEPAPDSKANDLPAWFGAPPWKEMFHRLRALIPLLVLFAPGESLFGFQIPLDATGLGYTNFRVADVPWSIHVVQVSRTNSVYEFHSVHAANAAVGLETLSDQLGVLNPAFGSPVAAINGDFYQRERAYAGAPRGLQIIDGELISGPGNKIALWFDADGEAHGGSVTSKFEVTWPDGTATPFRLNAERAANGVELYTPAVGRSTRTMGGQELVLERAEGSAWLPLHVGKTYTARVREVREGGDNKVPEDALVLSLGPGAARRLAAVQAGATVRISTATDPALHGVRTALSGGPLLVHNGHRQRLEGGVYDRYETSSMFERHPRAAIGWNAGSLFLVEVDGRQSRSAGMTLDELANFLVVLGCQEGMNCDGGGSATLWFQGEVRNSPCERAEREIANSLVVVKKKVGATNAALPAK